MELKFSHKKTKVTQLAEFIETAIASEQLKVGDSLPSINTLSTKYNVSRDTVFKSLLQLKEKGLIDSIHGKNYFVSSHSTDILLLLDEYSPFKEALYSTLRERLPESYHIDLWFHQYNKELFDNIINNVKGKYGKYIVMNYDNEELSGSLTQLPKEKLMLIDFGKFQKEEYAYVCQDFDELFYEALNKHKADFKKYNQLIYVLDPSHKHPQSSKEYFLRFCNDNDFSCEVHHKAGKIVSQGACYIVVKPNDVVKLVKACRSGHLKMGEDFGLIAYNENPFYEIIGTGISSIGIDWSEMATQISKFVLHNRPMQTYLKTKIIKRGSF